MRACSEQEETVIACPTPGCRGMLRQLEGVHGPGDAPVVYGPGSMRCVRCPNCKKLIPWPLPSPSGGQQNAMEFRP